MVSPSQYCIMVSMVVFNPESRLSCSSKMPLPFERKGVNLAPIVTQTLGGYLFVVVTSEPEDAVLVTTAANNTVHAGRRWHEDTGLSCSRASIASAWVKHYLAGWHWQEN